MNSPRFSINNNGEDNNAKHYQEDQFASSCQHSDRKLRSVRPKHDRGHRS